MDLLPNEIIWEVASYLIASRNVSAANDPSFECHKRRNYSPFSGFLNLSSVNKRFRTVVLNTSLHHIEVTLPQDYHFIQLLPPETKNTIGYAAIRASNFRVSPHRIPELQCNKLLSESLYLLSNLKELVVSNDFIDYLRRLDTSVNDTPSSSTSLLEICRPSQTRLVKLTLPPFLCDFSTQLYTSLLQTLNSFNLNATSDITLCSTCEKNYHPKSCIIPTCQSSPESCPICLFQSIETKLNNPFSVLTCPSHQEACSTVDMPFRCSNCPHKKGSETCVNQSQHPYVKKRFCKDCAVFEIPYGCGVCGGMVCLACVAELGEFKGLDSVKCVECMKEKKVEEVVDLPSDGIWKSMMDRFDWLYAFVMYYSKMLTNGYP
ncbi:hypothetical protein BKA69DRAFT_1124380 [Paraphysoderma sedebokerense]|nr:hypothetical protein BKA69DRAFT_1124380 [Paraphysoderma sedebokerense]